jgi:hypothetical protein
VGPDHAGGEQTVLTAHAISPGCGLPRSWGEFIKKIKLVANVNGLAVREVNLQSGLYKSYASRVNIS